MARKKKDKPWHLNITWALSIVMLLLISGFFFQSFQEMLKIGFEGRFIESMDHPILKQLRGEV